MIFAIVRADYSVAVRRLPLVLTRPAARRLRLLEARRDDHGAAPAERPSPTSAVDGTVLYEGGDWAVVTSGNDAVALRFRNGAWHPDRTRTVKISFLGPDSPAPAQPQVAAELRAPTKLAESALWVDGVELLEKGGGLTADARDDLRRAERRARARRARRRRLRAHRDRGDRGHARLRRALELCLVGPSRNG